MSDPVRDDEHATSSPADELARSNRALRMLSDSNQALIRAADEPTLLSEICRIAVVLGDYQLAWIGLLDDDAPARLRTAAVHGPAAGYIDDRPVPVADLIADALSSGAPQVAGDLSLDADLRGRRAAAVAAGLRAAIALPLRADGRTLGVFKIYAAEPTGFDAREIETLMELAGDVAYGIVALRMRDEHTSVIARLQRSNRALEAAQRLAHVGHFERDLTDDQVEFSSEMLRLFGEAPTTRQARMSLDDFRRRVVADDWHRLATAIDDAVAGRGPLDVEYRLVRPDGEVRDVRLQAEVVRDADGPPRRVFGAALDITEAKRTEEALRRAERQLRTLVESFPDFLSRLDRAGRYQFVSPSALRATGTDPAVLLGHTPVEVGVCADPRQDQALQDSLARVVASGFPESLAVEFQTLDGPRQYEVRLIPERDDHGHVVSVLSIGRDLTERRVAEAALRASEERLRQVTSAIAEVVWLTDATRAEFIYVSPAYERVFGGSCAGLLADGGAWLARIVPEDRPRFRAAIEDLRQGGYDLEYRIRDAGGAVRWIHDHAVAIVDEHGATVRIAGVAEDVTRRRLLEDQLRQAQKLEAAGQLAGGIAHDFNNILAIIQMQSSLLLDERATADDVREGIGEIVAASERAANLTRQLLTFSRRQVSQPVVLDLAETAANMIKLLRRVLGENVELQTRFTARAPLVHADPGMMEQVLMNLAINARDAMPSGGRLTVAVAEVEVAGERATRNNVRPGHYVELAVADTGSGITPDDLPHIFEPFFTTKEVGKGTGLGLATVFGIVQQHQGWLEVDSEPGRGTEFRMLVPAVERQVQQVEGARGLPSIRGGHETILVVEDEPIVRATTRLTLERFGYRVLEADSAAVAMVVWYEADRRIDLLLTDLIMPGVMTGRQLADALLAQAPQLKVIYTSGYSPEVLDRVLPLGTHRTLLPKPYSALALAARVRETLDQGTGSTHPTI